MKPNPLLYCLLGIQLGYTTLHQSYGLSPMLKYTLYRSLAPKPQMQIACIPQQSAQTCYIQCLAVHNYAWILGTFSNKELILQSTQLQQICATTAK
jgi:hypothetical protein